MAAKANVAPLAGAWIEIRIKEYGKITKRGRSPCGSVDRNPS